MSRAALELGAAMGGQSVTRLLSRAINARRRALQDARIFAESLRGDPDARWAWNWSRGLTVAVRSARFENQLVIHYAASRRALAICAANRDFTGRALLPLDVEQVECLNDPTRREEAFAMIDDLEARVGLSPIVAAQLRQCIPDASMKSTKQRRSHNS